MKKPIKRTPGMGEIPRRGRATPFQREDRRRVFQQHRPFHDIFFETWRKGGGLTRHALRCKRKRPSHGHDAYSPLQLGSLVRRHVPCLHPLWRAPFGWSAFRPGQIDWWIVTINMLGSILFMISGVASFVDSGGKRLAPLPGDAVTAVSARCFRVGVYLLIPRRPRPGRRAAQNADPGER